MIFQFEDLIITFTLFENDSDVVATKGCKEFWEPETPGELQAVCNNTEITEIPQDFSSAIMNLVLIRTYQINLNKNSFTRYPNLTRISIEEPVIRYEALVAHESAFLSLSKLKELNIEHMRYITKFKWPASISNLYVSGNNFVKFDVSYLKMLQKLHVANCSLREIPKIHQLAPLRVLDISSNPFWYDIDLSNLDYLTVLNVSHCNIPDVPEISDYAPVVLLDVRGNPLDRLTVESLARYCSLERLKMNYTVPSDKLYDPVTKEKYCQCYRLEKWLAYRGLPKDDVEIYCKSSEILEIQSCSFEFDRAMYIRQNCLTNQGKLRQMPEWFTILLVTAIAAILFMLIIVLVHYVF